MEAARLAALRGHRVTLYEKEPRLGGSLFFASIVNSDNEPLLDWMITQVKKLPIDVRSGKAVDATSLKRFNPDTVIVAVGPQISIPIITGMDNRQVITGVELKEILRGQDSRHILKGLTGLLLPVISPLLKRLKPARLRWLSRFWMPVGKNVVIAGGDMVAAELAEFLLARGRKVTIVAEQRQIAPEMAIPRRWRVMRDLRKNGVALISAMKYEEVNGVGLVISGFEETRQTIPADTVIITGEIQPDTRLFDALKDKFSEAYQAGDGAKTSYLIGSIADATDIGLKI